MDINSICPFVRDATILTFVWKDKENNISADNRLFYLLSGKGKIYCENKPYDISSHTLIILSSGTEYRFEIFDEQKCELVCINFDFYYNNSEYKNKLNVVSATRFDNSLLFEHNSIEPLIIPDYDDAKAQVLSLINEFYTKRPFYEGKSSAILKNIIIDAYQHCLMEHPSNIKNLAENISDFIYLKYNTPLSVEMISKEFNYHPYYLGKVFKQYYGKSILAHLNDIRLISAKEMINHTDFTMEEISQRVGYTNYSHFSALFKQKFGVSPINMRRTSISSI